MFQRQKCEVIIKLEFVFNHLTFDVMVLTPHIEGWVIGLPCELEKVEVDCTILLNWKLVFKFRCLKYRGGGGKTERLSLEKCHLAMVELEELVVAVLWCQDCPKGLPVVQGWEVGQNPNPDMAV